MNETTFIFILWHKLFLQEKLSEKGIDKYKNASSCPQHIFYSLTLSIVKLG
jgi:hypothetical protein